MVHLSPGGSVRCWFHCAPPALPGAGGDPDAAAVLCLTGSPPIERFVFGSLEETRVTASVCCGDR
jgi:hypothetical protein